MSEWDAPGEMERLAARRGWVLAVTATFAQRLRDLRSHSGKSQQHVALTMALLYGHSTWHQTTVAKVEAGERDVKLAEAVALAEILNVSLQTLIGDDAEEARKDPHGEHPEA